VRKTPYTQTGIRRLKCFRCGAKAEHQWQICSDGNQFRPVCLKCDIKLNRLVLEFMGFDDVDGMIKKYEQRMKI